MDCQSAQHDLELLGFRQQSLAAPEFHNVSNHLATCTRCRAYFDQLAKFDQRIAAAINNVAVPENLQSRILANLTENQHPAISDVEPLPSAISKLPTGDVRLSPTTPRLRTRRIDRRTWLQAAGTSALGLAAACSAWWINDRSGNQMSLSEFRQWAGSALNSPQEFYGTFLPRLPNNRWRTGVVQFGEHFIGMRPNRSGRHTIAAVHFSLPSARHVNGVVLVTPAQFLTTVPEIDFFHSGEYVTLAEQGTSSVAWNENDFVFACCVTGDSQQLERIEQALGSASPV